MQTVTYRVPGMSCDHCKQAVATELAATQGVEQVDVDLDSKIVVVRGAALNDEALRAAIVEAGYEAD